jgi:GNAT superfamily N-acetyltransferase
MLSHVCPVPISEDSLIQYAYSFLPDVTIILVDSFLIAGQERLSLLDNPAWSALSTTHKSFSEGDELAKRYPSDVAPFGATRDQSSESYRSLAKLLSPGETAALPLSIMPILPPGWTLVRRVDSCQMVWNGSKPPPVNHTIEDLNISHVDEMLALVELTKPGPFLRRTPELGTYLGIRESDKLVAMAGERLRPLGHTEISAVCTHPEYRGRGYASSLVSTLIQTITKRGEIPFLHVRTENVGAIRVYEKLGFKNRRVINIALVKHE